MAVKGSGIELGEDVNSAEPRIDTVRNGYVHDAVLASQGHGRLGAVLGKRKQSRALPAPHDDAEDFADVERLAARL